MTGPKDRERQTLGIVIPTVGQRPELKRMLESIVAQTRPVQRIRIVVDSNDTSLVDGIVSELAEPLSTIDIQVTDTGVERAEGVYLVDEAGHGYAMSRGLEMLDTDLIAILDDDDEILPYHFAQLEAALDPAAGVGVAYSRVAVVKPDGSRRLYPKGPLPAGRMTTSVIIDRQPVLLPASLIHRSALALVGNVDESFDRLADTDMLVRLGLVTRFAAVDDPTYIYHRVSRRALISERVLGETARLLKRHQRHLTVRERVLFWDTQARQALRAGLPELGREAADELVSVLWSPPPRLFVDWYVRVRSRETPQFVKRLAGRFIGPISGRTTRTDGQEDP